ncbi:MAG: peptidylprolyl isomerase [Peptoniphilaceae bacterium]|nr:peptidylprolyl isomerase [Peptoniphilaceae bacterium]MDD7382951.1 peptidylprolyl isomerase [Peptoniphilaceae bacterium]MDY3737702.1 peptidylprolyl isomerase [Peptoniphilaceae bacterium]
MTQRKLMAEINGEKLYEDQVVEYINMLQNPKLQNKKGIDLVANEMINQQLLYIDAQENGIFEREEVKEELKKMEVQFLKQVAQFELFKNVKVTEDEIKEYYDHNKENMKLPESFKASHILVDTLNEAKEIKKKIDDGQNFENLAKKYSKDTQTGINGGDLGEFPKGTMVKEFEEELENLKDGEISNPVKTEFGYHIIKLDHKHDEVKLSFEQSKSEIKERLKLLRQQELYLSKTDEIKERVKVKKYF